MKNPDAGADSSEPCGTPRILVSCSPRWTLEHVLALDSTVEVTRASQALHSSLRCLSKLSNYQFWQRAVGQHVGDGDAEMPAREKWNLPGSRAALEWVWSSSSITLVQHDLGGFLAWVWNPGLVPSPAAALCRDRVPRHHRGTPSQVSPPQGWEGPHTGKLAQGCPFWALLQQSSGASAEMLCWIKFQQRNLSESFYLYPCSCQGDLNPSRSFSGKCVQERFIYFSCDSELSHTSFFYFWILDWYCFPRK